MADFEKKVIEKFNINALHDYQKDVIGSLCANKSVFVCQRTGRGKGLCYQAFTTAFDTENMQESIVLVISPLISIMEEQTAYLQAKDITAVMLNQDYRKDLDAKQGRFQYIYGSPEIFLGQSDWRDTLKSKLFQDRVQLIVIDEVHLVIHW